MSLFFYESQGTNTYLVYTVKPEDEIDTMSLGMLTNNRISGIANTFFTQMDTTKYIKYNVSAHISAKQFFFGPVNRKRLIGVFSGIVDAMISAEDYMIDTNSILLDMDYIFADVSTCETVLICLPIRGLERENTDLGAFFKNIVFSTQFDQTENCDYVAKIINYLNSTPMFSLIDFKAVLESVSGNGSSVAPTPVQPKVQTAVPQTEVPAKPVQTVAPTQVNPIPQPVSQPVVQKPVVQQPVPPVSPVKPMPGNIPAKPPVQSASGFSVPGGKQIPPAQPNSPQVNGTPETGEKMSMFYLLQHYNKDNVAIYKAQKDKKKKKKEANVVPTQPVNNSPFAVPGSPANNGGSAQKVSAVPNTGFAIPGQPAQRVSQTFNQTAVQQPQKQPVAPISQPAAPVSNTVPSTPQPSYQSQSAMPVQSMNFGETTVLGGGGIGETTVLGAGSSTMPEKPYLLRIKNNERINLDKPVFRLGKERSYVDYFIGDNSAISRSHANIINKDGKFFIIDTNSTNHTFVDGAMISSNTEVEIKHGVRIKLANEEFEFKMF